jgi:hypothetical protein
LTFGREQQRHLLQARELPGEEAVEQALVLGEDRLAVARLQREVDVARVALALVVLGHVGDRHALLAGDLLGAVLVDDVRVGGGQRVRVVEVHLVLAEVALALGVLDLHAGRRHVVADAADERLDARGAQQGVVDVVEVGRLELAVGLVPRLLVGVAEHDELELGARGRLPAPLGEPVELAAQDLPRGGRHRRAVAPRDVGHAQRGPRLPRDGRSVSRSGAITKSS